MGKSLVIVESPAKIKTINKILGKDFIVKSSIGHIRDLGTQAAAPSAKGRGSKLAKVDKDLAKMGKLIQRMGVDPENGWRAHYEILPGKAKVLQGLQEYAKKVDKIYLATDLDREGEAIAWHLREAIGGDDSMYQRVTFTEITKKAVLAAFDNPGTINLNRVDAYKARRFLDRVVGFMLSPLLWQKVARGLSAGRVQSVAVRLISEREKEIHAFKTQEYWELRALVKKGIQNITLEVAKKNGQTLKLTSQQEVDALLPALKSKPYKVSDVEVKSSTSNPSAPFITSTLQQAASVRLGYSVKKTMTLAQKLYEAGFITYMRTDSTNLSQDAVEMCRTYITKTYGKAYLPEKPLTYSSKKSAQEAHEAIRPSDISLSSTSVAQQLGGAELGKLYQLIWQQFVACQMTSATYDSTSIVVQCGEFDLKTRGRVLTFDGFLKVIGTAARKGEEDFTMPAVVVGDMLALSEVQPSQHFTKPPPRYTEANLVRELVKRGIGRPSTYATIISTIQDRGYVKVEKRRFFCLKIGEIVTDRLVENFQDLMDFGFTASLEEDLDKIAEGHENWQKVLDTFYKNFTQRLSTAAEEMRGNPPTESSIPCPNCGRTMNIRTARTGVFMSCSGYGATEGEPCKHTINLIPGEEVADIPMGDDDEGNVAEIRAKKRCPRCDTAMDSYLVDAARKIHVCGNNPECPGIVVEAGSFRIKGYEGPSLECDKCGKEMQLKTGRFGKYFGCTGSPDCSNTRKLLRSGEAAPPKVPPIPMPELPCAESSGYFVLRDGAAGLFLAASTFPKSRETRKPTVADLRRHKKEIDPKYAFLLESPDTDPEGNASTIRFSRKSKQHFIMSEHGGKATGWALFWRDQRWQEGKDE